MYVNVELCVYFQVQDLKEQLNERKSQIEDLQLQLGKREEELAQAMLQIDQEGAGKAQVQKVSNLKNSFYRVCLVAL